MSPISASSSKPRATRVNIAPEATGSTTTSGERQPSGSAISYAERLRALRVERPQIDVHEAPAGLVGDLQAETVDVVVGAVIGTTVAPNASA